MRLHGHHMFPMFSLSVMEASTKGTDLVADSDSIQRMPACTSVSHHNDAASSQECCLRLICRSASNYRKCILISSAINWYLQCLICNVFVCSTVFFSIYLPDIYYSHCTNVSGTFFLFGQHTVASASIVNRWPHSIA